MKNYFKTILSTILCYLMVISMFPLSSVEAHAAVTYTGSGTETNPYVVSTGAELVSVFESYNTEDVYIELDSNITLDETYEPISFKGHFDGNFYKITTKTNFLYSNSGTIKNFYLVDTVERTDGSGVYAGLVTDYNSGVISGVIATGNLNFACGHGSRTEGSSAPSEVGMISGNNSGTIINCAAFGSIRTNCAYGSKAAGISLFGTVVNCYAVVDVVASGSSRYGSSKDDPIGFSQVVNSYYNKDVYTSSNYGLSTSKMKTADFVDMLNSNLVECDSKWVMDTSNLNSGYPILKRMLAASITSSKENILIKGTESVSLTCNDSSAKIYYTLNGTTPTTSSMLYSRPISISSETKINAVAYKNGLYSNVFSFNYAKISGSGTAESPYLINSEISLRAINELCSGDLNTAHYVLTNHISMTDEMPHLGNFYGVFDGCGYTISNVYTQNNINGIFEKNYGLIQNLNIEIRSNNRFVSDSGIVSDNYGMLYNCNVKGFLYSGTTDYFGGVVARNFGYIEKCNFDGIMYASGESSMAGGFVGHNDGEIRLCSFKGEIDVWSVYWYAAQDLSLSQWQGYVGGFVGYNTGEIYDSVVNASSVSGAARNYTGVYVGVFTGRPSSSSLLGCSAKVDSISDGGYHYLEWGEIETNYICQGNGVIDLPTDGHVHNFTCSLKAPVCGQFRQIEFSCTCGISKFSEFYDSNWYNQSHNYDNAEYIVTKNQTCSGHGEYVRYCNNCNYADTYDVLPSNHNEMVLVHPSLYPESSHEYENNLNETKVFTYPNATQLQITFSSSTYVWSGDYIYIYDGSDKLVGSYTYGDLRDVTKTIQGDTVKIKLVSNSSGTDYGYSLTHIYANCPQSEVVVDSSLYPESAHNYSNYASETKTFSYPGASSLELNFSDSTCVEQRYDYIYLYDSNGGLIGKYTGTELAGETITVSGDSFSIKLTSDGSYVYYGYSFDSIIAKINADNWTIEREETCTENGVKKRICSLCGEEVIKEIPAPGHTRETIPAVSATCTETGLTTGTKCSVCDKIISQQSVVAARGHKYSAEEITSVSCTQDGVIKYTCSECGDSYTENVPAINHVGGEVLIDSSKYPQSSHNYSNNTNQSKTFTWNGAKQLIITFSTSTKVENNYDKIYLYDATGNQIGSYTGTSLAGKTITIPGETFTIKLTSDSSNVYYGYSFSSIVADMGGFGDWIVTTEPTCVEEGVEKRVCTICNIEETRVVSAIGHNMIDDIRVEPDCVNPGQSEGAHCSRCDYKEGQEIIPALGHDFKSVTINPSCTEAGYTVYKCNVCEYTYDSNIVDALGHSYESTITKVPTCLEEGVKTFTCECGDSYTETVSALGHSYDSVVTNPTCTEDGFTTYTCSICRDSYISDEVSSLGHSEEKIPAVAPNCTETGLTEGIKCSVCNNILTEQEIVPANGHDFDYTMSEENLTRPTETSDGYYTFTCKNGCGATETQTVKLADYSAYHEAEAIIKGYLTNSNITDAAKQEIMDAIKQNAQNSDYFDENGNIRKDLTESEQHIVDTATSSAQELIDSIEVKISNGEYTKPDYSEIDEKINEIDEILKYTTISDEMKSELEDIKKELEELKKNEDASQYDVEETLDGLMDRLDEITSTIDKCANGNHSFTNYVITKEAGCETNGVNTATCDNGCGATDEEVIPAVGHNMIKDNAVAPDCTNTGLTEGSHCSRCYYKIAQEVIPATGHSYTSEVTKVPTHTESGVRTYTCNCGHSYTESIEVTGDHAYVDSITKEATCTSVGEMTFVCICGSSYTEEIPALGHDYATDYTVDTEATCTTEGSKSQHCSRCDSTTNVTTIPTVGHNFGVWVIIIEATCTNDGEQKHTCDICGDSETESIESTGHNYVNGKCKNCGDKDVYYYNGTFHIQSPSMTTIRHKDGIKLHADVEGAAPAGSYVVWTADNDNFKTEEIEEGKGVQIISDKNGYTRFTATLYSADGEILATDTIEMNSKAGFFDKIGSFFRSLFGGTKIYEN